MDTIPNEGDAEVVGGVVGGAKKWSVEEDKRLICAWINIGIDAVVVTKAQREGQQQHH